MESKANAAANSVRSEEFDPPSEWVRDDHSELLMLELSGFKKENLKVMLTTSGNIEITGERYVDGNRRRWFRKVVSLPANCNTNEIRAKFEDGLLYVIFPLIAGTSRPTEKQAAAPESPSTAAKSSGDQAKAKLAAAKEAVATGTGKLQEKLSSAKTQVDEKKEKVSEAASSGAGKLKEKVSSTKTEVDEKKEKVGEAAGGGAGKLKEKVSSMMAEVGEKKAKAVETAGATAGKLKEKVVYKTNELAGGISKRKTPLANVVAAVVILVGIGLYVYYKFKSPVEEINSKLNSSGIINM